MLLAQGNTYQLPIKIKVDNEQLTPENAKVVEVAFECGGSQLIKNYPGEIVFEDGVFVLPLSQEDTFALRGRCSYQVRVLLFDGNVINTDKINGNVSESISKVVLK